MALLNNAAAVDISTGNVERAIERLLRLLELTREHKERPFEGHALFALGTAYLVRGDMAQATTFHVEALKLRRTIEDSGFLMASLLANGSLARATGDIPGALRLHREALALATLHARVDALLELARDYAAESNFQRAVAACREALAVPLGAGRAHWNAEVQLALAEALLSQPRKTPAAVSEAATLSQDALGVAINRADPGLEIAARRMLAQSHGARADFASARAEYERAIGLIFKYRSTINNPELQASAADHERQVYRGYVDLLMRDVALRGPGKLLSVNASEENALRTLEWARAINFDAARVSSLDAHTQARVDELLAKNGREAYPHGLVGGPQRRRDARTRVASARHRQAARGSRWVACHGRARSEGCRHFTDGGRTVAGDACRDYSTFLCARNRACISLGTRRVGNSCDGPGRHACGDRPRTDDARSRDPQT